MLGEGQQPSARGAAHVKETAGRAPAGGGGAQESTARE